jgi:hypothetical protein
LARFRRGASLEGGAKLSVAFSRGLANGLIVFPSERTNGSSDHKSSGPFAAPTTLLKVDRAISVECVIESKSRSERMRAHQPFLHRPAGIAPCGEPSQGSTTTLRWRAGRRSEIHLRLREEGVQETIEFCGGSDSVFDCVPDQARPNSHESRCVFGDLTAKVRRLS